MENKNIDYNDPDAFLKSGVFNSPNYVQRRNEKDEFKRTSEETDRRYIEHQQRSAILREQEERNIRKFQQSKNKSISNKKRTKDSNRRGYSQMNKINLQRKVAIGLCTITSVIALAIPATIKAAPIVENKIQTLENVDRSTDLLMAKAYNNLTVNDLAGIDIETGKFVIKENTIEDYRKLGIVCNAGDINSHVDVYIYKLILPEEEFNKFIKAVAYNDGLHYYISMEQFLNINGYYVKGTNSPSNQVFNNMIKEQINEISPELLNEYATSDGTYTVADFLESETPEGKGR